MNVGKAIKDRRKQLGMSAETLAELVGVSPTTIYRYEKGNVEKVDSAKLVPIATALGVTPGYLMGWEDVVIPDKETLIPKTFEARIVSGGMDKLPKAQRDQILAVVRAMFANNPDLFK